MACAGKAPITQKLLDESLARINKAGELENIERWCSWTPTQLSLLELAANLEKVVITGGNGTGKTVVLDAFAVKTFLNLALLTATFDLYFINLNSCRGNYSREETIQGRKLFAEIR